MRNFVIGIDFGTLSARALLVDARSGVPLEKNSVFVYPHGVINRIGELQLPKDYALQDPDDYEKAIEFLLRDIVEKNGVAASSVVGIGVDFTSCTLIPLDDKGCPLSKNERFSSRPHAYVKLWKHHGAEKYLPHINEAVTANGGKMLESTGNAMSSEFLISKIYETFAEDREVYENTSLFINAGDYICSILAGGASVHSMAYAVIKEHYAKYRGGYPSKEFFASLAPGLKNVVNEKLNPHLNEVGECVGSLSKEWANRTGLNEGIAIATPLIDAQSPLAAMGLETGKVLMILGTSAVMAVNTDRDVLVNGVLSKGVGSCAPDVITFEAALSAMGDLFDWFVKNCVPSSYEKSASEAGLNIHEYLCSLAEKRRIGDSGLVALDWWNGNRSVIPDDRLSGTIVGLRLSTKPEDIYRALIESTAFAMRRIYENYIDGGIRIDEIWATGGIAYKNPMLMQIFADVFGKPINLLACAESACLGAAINAAAAAGEYVDLFEASKNMRCGVSRVYAPINENVEAYENIYRKYLELYEGFGRSEFMHELFDMRQGNE